MVRSLPPKSVAVTLLGMSLSLTLGCSNAGKGDGEAGSASTNQGPVLGAGADVTKPSRILITPKASWSDLKGYIVGRADSSSLVSVADQDGKFGFLNLSSGSYDIVLEANEKGSDGKFSKVALKISGIKLAESADAQIRDIDLKPYVKLEGKVLLDGEASVDGHAGVAVSIPGTPYRTLTAADGSYSFPEVPEGDHNFEMTQSGYNGGFLLAKTYRANDRIPTIALSRDSNRLENGVHYLGEPVVSGSAQKISLQLRAPSAMNFFRYGVNGESLESRPWIILQSSLEIDLPAGAKPEVSVQYSLDQRQLSSVYSVAVPVE